MTDTSRAMTQLSAMRDTMASTSVDSASTVLDEYDDFRALGDERGELLQHAVSGQYWRWVSLLLERGFELTLEQAKRQPLLPHAATNIDLCRMLVNLGIDVNEQDAGDITALHRAVIYAREDVCEFLLDSGADPNLFDSRGQTPLHHVTLVLMPTALKLAQMLVRAGAISSIVPAKPREDYLTPFQSFCKDARCPVVEFFIECGGEDPKQIIIDGRELCEIVSDAQMRQTLLANVSKRCVATALGDDCGETQNSSGLTSGTVSRKAFSPI